jgi:formamidopyrimidine-DNA glycosylase
MPELPEVETTVRGLAPVLDGRRLTTVEPRRGDLRRPFPPDLRQRLTGARVPGFGRCAKYGLIHADRGDTLVFHLGMSGRWRLDPEELLPHDHLLLETEAGRRLTLYDPRRFGSVDLVPTDSLESWPPFAALGPEPLSDAFSAEHLAAMFMGRKAPVKSLLLDQRVVAGLGNIYVCEALYESRILPTRAAGTIPRRKLDALAQAVRDVLLLAIAAGGSTLRDYAQPDGGLGYFSKTFKVYGREGKPCECGGTVARRVDAGRSTFYCPRCQK